MRRIGKFLSLGFREKMLLLEAIALLFAASVWLRFRPLAGITSWTCDSSKTQGDSALISAAARMVDSAACMGLRRNTCLEKSIALSWMLRRRGIATTLQIGCSTPGNFQGHAWLEINGVPINDAPDIGSRFTPLRSS